MEHHDHIRVLIADDSFFIRSYLATLLRAVPEIEVVATASTGNEVVRLAHELHPDVITMDYHMPEKNGMEAVAEIMLGDQLLPAIIMLSAFAGPEGKEVLRTLEGSGAHVIAKPSGEISLDIERISREIVTKVCSVGALQRKVRKAYKYLEAHKPKHPSSSEKNDTRMSVVVVGASTGGPPLVEHLLTMFSPDSGAALVIVQHMSKYFTELFAERLDRTVRFSVREAKDGDALLPGTVLVVPGGFSVALEGEHRQVRLVPSTAGHPEDAINRTMTAIAESFTDRVFGVLLSGMGSDGTEGLRAIKKQGGTTLVQDPRTAAAPSMPLSALQKEIVDEVLSVEEMSDWISKKISK